MQGLATGECGRLGLVKEENKLVEPSFRVELVILIML